ncbi:hypothetical protein P152DRAFT_447406 [Eremomyces bilateralis CBS 781.70]|uniref:Asteroid domain-containing protein n=1 Tax=Eremomyces bilateralis CBS 781.70 TaxID=1392243 RepID=A0A6G1GAR0_9PEZI|nr:uncharacterized protein P152DRAFT_447406 [Eremomyces bilateralis CBS 781.70]KAF1815155.1 hypothetical protein P152DRAFT_447406 [Eremomyces bilateralis CBS 781.70]
MGIARLHHLLQPYGAPFIAEFSPPSNTTSADEPGAPTPTTSKPSVSNTNSNRPIILDGPSFAYHIHHTCGGIVRPRSQAAIPHYGDLARAAVAWLDQLERFGLRVVAIVFDGALPDWKIETRMGRLEMKVATLLAWKAGLGTGFEGAQDQVSRLGDSFGDDGSLFLLLRSCQSAQSSSEMPTVPFLTAAVVEGLLRSRFGHTVSIVSGEADTVCAELTKRHMNAIVLSSDGDLLVHDLGTTGSVMSFKSIAIEQSSSGSQVRFMLKSTIFSPSTIAARFQLRSLLPFGFCVRKLGRKASVSACIEAAKSLEMTDQAYQGFLEEYDSQPFPEVSSSEIKSLQHCDTTVSEYLCSQLSGTSREHVVPTIYLPVLIEDPSRSTAWDQSIHIRQVSYTLVSESLSKHSSPHTIELTRRGHRVVPVAVPHLSPIDLRQRITEELDLLSGLSADSGMPQLPTTLRWRAIVLFLLLPLLSGSSTNVIFSFDVKEFLKGHWIHRSDGRRTEWPYIHFSAQLQGIWCSLRMLLQTIRFLRSVSAEPLEMVGKLERELSLLPGVVEFFDDAAAEDGVVEEVLGWLELKFSDVIQKNEASTKTKRKRKAKGQSSHAKEEGLSKKAATQNGTGYFSVLRGLETD